MFKSIFYIFKSSIPVVIIIFILPLIISCSGDADGSSIVETETSRFNVDKSVTHPNGSSELALLMRDLYDEAEKVKERIENNKPVTLTLDYSAILSAHATDPKAAASLEFKAFGNAYLQTIESLQNASPSEAKTHYDQMVNQCMNCHRALCPGPMKKIKKLM